MSIRQCQPLVLGGYILICAATALHMHFFTSQVNADASAYVDLALGWRKQGSFGHLDPVRTYGYVSFLYFCSFLLGGARQALVWGAAGMQALLYAGAVWWLAMTVAARSRALGDAVRIGLLLNPILIALVMDTMTESLTLIVTLVMLTALLRAAAIPVFSAKLPWLIGGAALASFSVMIRPANWALLLAWNVAILPILFDSSLQATLKRLFAYGATVSAISLLVWSPQLDATHRASGHASVFPAGLGNLQIAEGIRHIKYATQVNADHIAAAMPYPNPWLTGIADTQSWTWYFSNSWAGPLTAAGHVFNALNYDHPFVYVYDTSLPWSVPLAFICWVVYSLAAADIVTEVVRWRERSSARPEFVPGVLFLSTMTAASLATISISQPESRFSTLILAAAGVLACHCMLRMGNFSGAQRFRIAATSVATGILGVLISEWMKALLKLG